MEGKLNNICNIQIINIIINEIFKNNEIRNRMIIEYNSIVSGYSYEC